MKYYRYYLEYESVEIERSVELIEFLVIRETPKWYWISTWYSKEKWVPKKDNSRTQFAWNTKEKAMYHFINRTSKRIGWYKYYTEECKEWVKIWEKILKDLQS